MSEIVRRSGVVPVSKAFRLDRQTSRALNHLRGMTLVQEADELVAAHIAQVRIDAGYRLAARTVMEIKGLHSLITELTRDNPGLEMEMRQIQAIVSIGSQQVLVNYMTRL